MFCLPSIKSRLPLLALLLLTAATAVEAQDYPTRPIKIVVPFAPGGGTDFLARLIGQKLADGLGQSVLVDNRPGGSTIIGAQIVAKAAPDGYTLLSSNGTTFSINQTLNKKLPYDPIKDFVPIALTGRFVMLLVVASGFPAQTTAELIAQAKAKPGQIPFASPGQASAHHLAMAQFMQQAGIDMVHVPFKGAGPAMQELLAGRVPVMFLDYSTAQEMLRAGRLRAIATATSERFAPLPAVPTLREAGFDIADTAAWQGLAAPAGTPPAIIRRLNAEVVRALAEPATRQRLLDAGIDPISGPSEQFAAYIRSEVGRWAGVIDKAGIKVEDQ